MPKLFFRKGFSRFIDIFLTRQQPSVTLDLKRKPKGWFRKRRETKLSFTIVVIYDKDLQQGNLDKAFVMRLNCFVNTSYLSVSKIADKCIPELQKQLGEGLVILSARLNRVTVGRRTNEILDLEEDTITLQEAKQKVRLIT